LLVTARDPVSGALLQSVTVRVRGKGVWLAAARR
jgi:hypothetical protein